MRTETDAHNKL